MKRFIAQQDGYSLVEILVVVVIIGILAMIAIPRFTNLTNRAKMVEAQTMLGQVATLQQAYYYQYDRYSTSLSAIGFEQATLIADGGTARYLLSIEQADEKGFTAIATSVVDFNNNGTFNVWMVTQTGVIEERQPD
jgi:type IV pilus assembly protein PilE